jgi:outer membrane lipopolysaccharide assembly protein LptE/RlpB
MKSMRIALILIVVLLAGCGYHTPGSSDDWVGGDARLLYIQLIDNQTAEPYLENFLTDALVAELSRSRVVTLTEDQTQAEVRLAGEIKEFTSSAFAYGTSDQITEYRATMRISVRLLRKDTDEVLWQKAFQRSEDYLASVNKNQKHEELEGQRLSARQVSLRLAEDIYSSLLNSF